MMHAELRRRFVIACLLAIPTFAGCAEQWEYRNLRDVQATMPGLLDKQWAKHREYTPTEMLAVQAGGPQTLLIARRSKKAIIGDVAQLDERVNRTFVMALDGPPQAGKTYRISPDNGRLIEGTSFRPAWRPYRGIEGEVTVLGVSKSGEVKAAVRVTTLSLRQSEQEQRLSGLYSFKPVAPGEPFLSEAQIRMGGQ